MSWRTFLADLLGKPGGKVTRQAGEPCNAETRLVERRELSRAFAAEQDRLIEEHKRRQERKE